MKVKFLSRCLTILLFTMCSLQGFAAGEDLICRPRDVFDAGFRVHAKIDENGVLNTEVMAVSGWGGDKKEFSGPSFLLYERINEGCVFKIVDKRDSPNTIIVLKVGGEDFLQRLKLAKALSKENFRLLISTSGNDYSSMSQLPNTYFSDFVPADSVLKISDLIICNGGTSTTYHGIASGTPVFTFPTNLDQYLHSHQLKIKGVADYENIDEVDLIRFVEKVFYLVSTEETKSHVIDLKNEIIHFQKENHLKTLLQQL
ncbi:MAG: hypothetical protein L6Q37_04790 [Bdellovibrionaceae bacterium]|nr:hypothetical protein [Pseudobdellovibrionaceae bacterium]NUM60323.1 hypothetical protein [Pseudobdellovibrionaceae bacterium]